MCTEGAHFVCRTALSHSGTVSYAHRNVDCSKLTSHLMQQSVADVSVCCLADLHAPLQALAGDGLILWCHKTWTSCQAPVLCCFALHVLQLAQCILTLLQLALLNCKLTVKSSSAHDLSYSIFAAKRGYDSRLHWMTRQKRRMADWKLTQLIYDCQESDWMLSQLNDYRQQSPEYTLGLGVGCCLGHRQAKSNGKKN